MSAITFPPSWLGIIFFPFRADRGADGVPELVHRVVADAVFPGTSEAELHMLLHKLAHIGV